MASLIGTIRKTATNGPYSYDFVINGVLSTVVISKTLAACMNEIRDLVAAQPGNAVAIRIIVNTDA